jgi:hypothetical protein
VSTMVDDGGRELGGTSVLQLRPAERITAYAAIALHALSSQPQGSQSTTMIHHDQNTTTFMGPSPSKPFLPFAPPTLQSPYNVSSVSAALIKSASCMWLHSPSFLHRTRRILGRACGCASPPVLLYALELDFHGSLAQRLRGLP